MNTLKILWNHWFSSLTLIPYHYIVMKTKSTFQCSTYLWSLLESPLLRFAPPNLRRCGHTSQNGIWTTSTAMDFRTHIWSTNKDAVPSKILNCIGGYSQPLSNGLHGPPHWLAKSSRTGRTSSCAHPRLRWGRGTVCLGNANLGHGAHGFHLTKTQRLSQMLSQTSHFDRGRSAI